MIASVVQFDCSTNFDENFSQIKKYVKEYGPKTDLLVFPELIDYGYHLDQYKKDDFPTLQDYAEDLQFLSDHYSTILVIGGARIVGDMTYNSQYVFAPQSELQFYDKNYLFLGEQAYFIAGSDLLSPVSYMSASIGFSICFDLRYPEHFRSYTEMPEIIVVSAAWPAARVDQWQKLLIARAIENQCYIVASNRIGTDNGIKLGGNSLLVDPMGNILKQGSLNDELALTRDLDLIALKQLRASFPVLDLRKS